jgi:hypothetical protein
MTSKLFYLPVKTLPYAFIRLLFFILVLQRRTMHVYVPLSRQSHLLFYLLGDDESGDKTKMETRERCYDFQKISPKNWQKIAFFRKLHTANISKNSIIILVFEKKQLFRPKLSKIAENCDHNIGPVQSS